MIDNRRYNELVDKINGSRLSKGINARVKDASSGQVINLDDEFPVTPHIGLQVTFGGDYISHLSTDSEYNVVYLDFDHSDIVKVTQDLDAAAFRYEEDLPNTDILGLLTFNAGLDSDRSASSGDNAVYITGLSFYNDPIWQTNIWALESDLTDKWDLNKSEIPLTDRRVFWSDVVADTSSSGSIFVGQDYDSPIPTSDPIPATTAIIEKRAKSNGGLQDLFLRITPAYKDFAFLVMTMRYQSGFVYLIGYYYTGNSPSGTDSIILYKVNASTGTTTSTTLDPSRVSSGTYTPRWGLDVDDDYIYVTDTYRLAVEGITLTCFNKSLVQQWSVNYAGDTGLTPRNWAASGNRAYFAPPITPNNGTVFVSWTATNGQKVYTQFDSSDGSNTYAAYVGTISGNGLYTASNPRYADGKIVDAAGGVINSQ